jgi:hypothetical protein
MANGVATTATLAALIVDNLQGGTGTAKYIQSGTGTTTPATTDTDLVTSTGSRVDGTASQPTADVHQAVAVLSYTSTLAITEVGLFQTGSAADCCFRAVFTDYDGAGHDMRRGGS